jgi:hypothetical protein
MSSKFSYMSIAGTLLLYSPPRFSVRNTNGEQSGKRGKGNPRNKYLGSKFLMLSIIALGFVLIATILAFIAAL